MCSSNCRAGVQRDLIANTNRAKTAVKQGFQKQVRQSEDRATFFIITAGAVHHKMLPPACSMKVLCWNKSGYAKPNIPCWYQMGPRNVLHSMVKEQDTDWGNERAKTRVKLQRKQYCGHLHLYEVLYNNMAAHITWGMWPFDHTGRPHTEVLDSFPESGSKKLLQQF